MQNTGFIYFLGPLDERGNAGRSKIGWSKSPNARYQVARTWGPNHFHGCIQAYRRSEKILHGLLEHRDGRHGREWFYPCDTLSRFLDCFAEAECVSQSYPNAADRYSAWSSSLRFNFRNWIEELRYPTDYDSRGPWDEDRVEPPVVQILQEHCYIEEYL